MRIILTLLLLVLSSLAKESAFVKVLYKNGKVGLVDTAKVSTQALNARSDVVYVEPPLPMHLLDDVARSSSVVVAGHGNERLNVRTYEGQRLSLFQKGAEDYWTRQPTITFGGSCAGAFDNMSCKDGVLELSVRSQED